jgi:hypothetical protein
LLTHTNVEVPILTRQDINDLLLELMREGVILRDGAFRTLVKSFRRHQEATENIGPWVPLGAGNEYDFQHSDMCCRYYLQEEVRLIDESEVLGVLLEETKKEAHTDAVMARWAECAEPDQECEASIRRLRRDRESAKRNGDKRALREIEKQIKAWERDCLRAVVCDETMPPAWYQSYRYGRLDWGIHILVDAVPLFVDSSMSILQKAGTRGSSDGHHLGTDSAWLMAVNRILAHERFHFCFNLFLDMAEAILRQYNITGRSDIIDSKHETKPEARLYKFYTQNVYSETYQQGAVEESLASSWEYDAGAATLSSSAARWIFNHDEARTHFFKAMKGRSPGYRDFDQYMTMKDIRTAAVKLLKTTLRGGIRRGRAHGLEGEPFGSIQMVVGELLKDRDQLARFNLPVWLHRIH